MSFQVMGQDVNYYWPLVVGVHSDPKPEASFVHFSISMDAPPELGHFRSLAAELRNITKEQIEFLQTTPLGVEHFSTEACPREKFSGEEWPLNAVGLHVNRIYK
jgi:hypothetical protein